MKKVEKVIYIIIACLVVAVGVATMILYMVNPDLCKKIIKYVIEVMNKPLPIVGVTAAAVLVFLWKVLVTTRFGKAKLAEYERFKNELEEEYKALSATTTEELALLKAENSKLKEQMSQVCLLSTNKKIKNFGKDLLEYGKESINSNAKEE